MLSEQNQKILQDQFNSLPSEIQDAILESNWKESIRRLTEKYALHIDQGGALETIVFLTMLGIDEPANFVKNLREEVRVTESLAQAITKEVEENVFQKIRTAVMEKQSMEQADTADDIEVIEEQEDSRDPYRELPASGSKYVNGQHLDEESILDEIEDPASAALREHSDIEIPKEIYNSKDVDIVDEDNTSEHPTDQESSDALKSVLEQKAAGQPSAETTTTQTQNASINPQAVNPLHIRTLKSDIMRQKLENPSWTPDLEKTFSKNTKDIVEKASKEASFVSSNPSSLNNTPASSNTGANPIPNSPTPNQSSSDPYRETF